MHTILEQLDTLNLSSNEYLKSFTVTKMENSEKLSSSERKLSLSQGPAGLTSSVCKYKYVTLRLKKKFLFWRSFIFSSLKILVRNRNNSVNIW